MVPLLSEFSTASGQRERWKDHRIWAEREREMEKPQDLGRERETVGSELREKWRDHRIWPEKERET